MQGQMSRTCVVEARRLRTTLSTCSCPIERVTSCERSLRTATSFWEAAGGGRARVSGSDFPGSVYTRHGAGGVAWWHLATRIDVQ